MVLVGLSQHGAVKRSLGYEKEDVQKDDVSGKMFLGRWFRKMYHERLS